MYSSNTARALSASSMVKPLGAFTLGARFTGAAVGAIGTRASCSSGWTGDTGAAMGGAATGGAGCSHERGAWLTRPHSGHGGTTSGYIGTVRHSAGVFSLDGFWLLVSCEGIELGVEEEGEPGTGDCAATRAILFPSLVTFSCPFS